MGLCGWSQEKKRERDGSGIMMPMRGVDCDPAAWGVQAAGAANPLSCSMSESDIQGNPVFQGKTIALNNFRTTKDVEAIYRNENRLMANIDATVTYIIYIFSFFPFPSPGYPQIWRIPSLSLPPTHISHCISYITYHIMCYLAQSHVIRSISCVFTFS